MIVPLLRAMSGLLAWAMAFAILYAINGAVCSPAAAAALGLPPQAGRAILIAAWLSTLAGLALLSWRLWPPQRQAPLTDWLAPILAVTGLGSILFTGFPVLMATTCAP